MRAGNGRGGSNMRGERGGMRGRGGRGGRGRGVAKRSTRGSEPRSNEADGDAEGAPNTEYSEEDIKGLDLVHGGDPTPYEPTTGSEYFGSPVLSSPRGLVENIKYKMQVATSNTNGVHKIGGEHLARMGRGEGTLFESQEAKTIVQDFYNQLRKERAEELGWKYRPENLRTLSEDQRKILAKTWAAGHYELPKQAELDDIIGRMEIYARRNETYLPEHRRKLERKLRTLLPAQYQKSEAEEIAPKPV